jgi:glycosyltransferase involved in cell wall biosynthesis
MRVLLVITGLGVGGAEKVVTTLADKLVQKGHQVDIVFLYGAPSTFPANSNISVTKVDIRNIIFALLKLRKIVLKGRYNIIHSHMFHANVLMRCVKLVFRIQVPLVNTAHSDNEGGFLRSLIYRATSYIPSAFTNVSRNAARATQAKGAAGKGRVLCVPNGIDLSTFRDVTPSSLPGFGNRCSYKILTVGSFREAKGYDLLVQSASILAKNDVDFVWYIVGAGPLVERITHQISKLNLIDRVILLGIRHDVPSIMKSVDLFVSTSRWEGFGLAIAEAMASRTLVVSTNTAGAQELISDKAFLTSEFSAINIYSVIVSTLQLGDSEKERARARNLKAIENKYSLESVVEQWEILYSSVIDN